MRVIAGELGGRRLHAPPGRRTRPTSDRVREALFALLGDIAGNNVLDLYAGSGALGIEALSRGAAQATFVEAWSAATTVLARNLADLGVTERAALLCMPVERALPRLLQRGPFDLVLCDPPWTDLRAAERALAKVVVADLFSPAARLVVEHPADEPFELAAPALDVDRTRRWGDTAVSIFIVRRPPPAASHPGL